jgi:hypothetical protein
MQNDWPHLHGYWTGQPTAAPGGGGFFGVFAEPAASAELGTAELLDDDVIELDLRAEGEGGAIGHAVLRIASTEPQYAGLRQHLFSATPAGVAGAAAAAPRKVLFRPMTS